MKKRKFLAALLVATMAFSTVASATSNSPSDVNANDQYEGNAYSSGVNLYKDGYFEISLPGDLAFSIDPARQDSSLQVAGDNYNIINLGAAEVEVSVYPSVAKNEGVETKYEIVNKPNLVTGKAIDGTLVSNGAYADIASSRGLYLTVIPADAPSAGLATSTALSTYDIDGNGIFEFDYTAGSDKIGMAKLTSRAAYSWEGEPTDVVYVKGPKAASTTVSDKSIVINKIVDKRAAEEIAKDNGTLKDFVTGDSLKFYLPGKSDANAIKDNDGNIYGYTNTITSFTIAGAVNADSVYDAESLVFQAVYVVKSATPEKYSNYKNPNGEGGKLHLVENK